MRLLTKTTLYFLTALVTLLVLAGFYLFTQLSKEINNRSDKELITDEIAWARYIETEVESGVTFILKTGDIAIYPVDAPAEEYPTIKNTTGYNTALNSNIPYRQLSQVVYVSGVPYQIIIKKSQEQKAALVQNITWIMLFVFTGLFAATLLFNWAISRRLWRPFRRSLDKIRNAELQKMEALHFEETNTKEFNELNASLNYMAGKIQSAFVNMKEFTENAAHEMQTPLAVVQSKLELLLQDSNLSNEQVQSVLQANSALNRLGKLNQSLLLLAKIENNQYETNEEVSLAEISKKYLHLFYEMMKDKQLTTETNFDVDCKITLHPLLADSLVANLLGNAIKYNYNGGVIRIATTKTGFEISNTSHNKPIPVEKLFKRFNTSKENEETSNGLGLAIVKKIADTNCLSIAYHAENGFNTFELKKTGR